MMSSSAKLSDDQCKAIQKLNKLKVGALFMEPGTGKTLTAIHLIESTNTDFLLFMTPCRNKDNIENEIKKWNFDRPYLIAGIESLSQSDRIFVELHNKLEQYKHPFMVVDESLKIKNRKSKRSQRIMQLGRLAEFRLVLNGTPLSKNMMDVWQQMEFLSPKILKMGFLQFKDTFVHYIIVNKVGHRNQFIFKGYRNLDYLYSLISPFVYDSKLSIAPSKVFKTIEYSIEDNRQAYYQTRDKFLNMIYDNADIFLAMTQAMQHQYCCEPSKFDMIRDIVNDKTIVFCKFTKSRAALEEAFPYARILTYGTGSLGLNLQQYNQIIFFDKTFNYAQQEQAMHRIYRMGQTEDCKFINLTGDVGLESFIDTNISKKTSLLDAFKEAVINDKTKVILNEL